MDGCGVGNYKVDYFSGKFIGGKANNWWNFLMWKAFKECVDSRHGGMAVCCVCPICSSARCCQ